MIESFFTIDRPASGGYKEKGSKFLAFAHPVADSEQIKSKLDKIKKEYFDARHHCYGWILGADKSRFKAFDDGEPNHSAGDPILNQIKSKNLTNVLVVVVRYFGGIKLGKAGLITAYKAAAADALNQAIVTEQFVMKQVAIEYDYSETSFVTSLMNEFELTVLEREFKERCRIKVEVRVGKEISLFSKIKTAISQGRHIALSS